jgi:uncharacterized protein
MRHEENSRSLEDIIHRLKHYLPAQAPLKDFIHQNTLHAFQENNFFQATREASEIFGYKVSLTLDEYRELFKTNRIRKEVIEKVILEKKGFHYIHEWMGYLLDKEYTSTATPRIGKLRENWKKHYKMDLDSRVHPILFRTLCSYLDQGVATWNFPVHGVGFFESIRELEKASFSSFFKTKRAKNLLLQTECSLANLLKLVVGDESLYQTYLFDQQFGHQGWSGIVSTIENDPYTLIDRRKITLEEVIRFELLLEIDALESVLGDKWLAMSKFITYQPDDLFSQVGWSELDEVLMLWQEAFEWSYYDQALAGIQSNKLNKKLPKPSFQAFFCLDDRECSLRRHLEKQDPEFITYGTPGFFGVEFYYKPEHGNSYTKLCPAPVTPKFLIKEVGAAVRNEKDPHFRKSTHSLFRGWLITQTLGFWAALRLLTNIFRPSANAATSSSFNHVDKNSRLTVEYRKELGPENGLQIGFTVHEMAQRVENVLRSIGLIEGFGKLVYVIGHGASSANNPHYAAYDCGACSGRPGSVNSRVFCHMANHAVVREILRANDIIIPDETQFVPGLHDTTRDEILFYDENVLSPANFEIHAKKKRVFETTLAINAKERSRRFEFIDHSMAPEKIHKKMKLRAVSLFEPRPELNHATNALCIIGRRELTKDLFLDRRAFLNSYDWSTDPEGKYLLNILKAAAPVCGGINLEYFFSRVDNQKLGAGTKLPHNVMGLIGVANGIEGDLRPGLPSQMIEVHDPVRLLIVVEHFTEVILRTLHKSPETYQWFLNDWIKLVAVDPKTAELKVFARGGFMEYTPLKRVAEMKDIKPVFETHAENLPVYILN